MKRTDLLKSERIKNVKGYEGEYGITNFGRLWSYKHNKWLKIHRYVTGYEYVCLSKNGKLRTIKTHRLVAEAFVKNKFCKPQVNHKNGKKNDNRACNLEWVTARENLQHATDLGLNKVHKLLQSEKEIIVQLHKLLNYSIKQLADIFSVTYQNIYYLALNYNII